MQTGCFDYNKDDEYVIIHDNGKGKLIAWSVAEPEIHRTFTIIISNKFSLSARYLLTPIIFSNQNTKA